MLEKKNYYRSKKAQQFPSHLMTYIKTKLLLSLTSIQQLLSEKSGNTVRPWVVETSKHGHSSNVLVNRNHKSFIIIQCCARSRFALALGWLKCYHSS